MLEFAVIPGKAIQPVIDESRVEIMREVRRAYLNHHSGQTVNPDSYFLRFPEKPEARIIALPAYLGGDYDVAGIKWISSFPKNIERSIPRASAVLILNDYRTGYPIACMEASLISAARTAASAVLAAGHLVNPENENPPIAFIGAGIIARNIMEFFRADRWQPKECLVFDRETSFAQALSDHGNKQLRFACRVVESLEAAISQADVVILATTASKPYITDSQTFKPDQLILHISLRDLGPEIVLESFNILDDVEHCMKAKTSPHLAEMRVGHREFIHGTIAQVLNGEVDAPRDRPIIFSPFGLGVLDLAVGKFVLDRIKEAGDHDAIDGFYT